ncbi:MAG TPA: prenyltransferase/squalene oxidase repeat-containing protein [Kofleriaceae bacterium]|jgi:squalene-hopene/tetraprenyl-beta-curcumene cyclase|nr:prenyltransferase/squalene oxidase repeat-containing protein [Kofleriaceae bacterium]
MTTESTLGDPVAVPAQDIADRVEGALSRAHAAVRALQRTDGRWQAENLAGPFGTAWLLVFERFLGVLSERDAREGERHLRRNQRDDGSAPGWPFADRGTLEASCVWYAGMHAAGVPDMDPAMVRARAYICRRGGFEATTLLGRAVLGTAGVIPPEALPWLPLAFKLVPGEEWLLSRVFGMPALLTTNQVLPMIAALKAGRGAPSPWRHPVRALAYRRVIDYLTARQDPNGGWISVSFETLLCAATLYALGVPRSDPRITRALAFVNAAKRYDAVDGLSVVPFASDVWDTAQMVRGLVNSGMPADDPALARAAEWLIRVQSHVRAPYDWQTPPPWAPRSGGWAFEPGNVLNPDLDTTQEVLGALALVAQAWPRDGALAHSIDAGEAWLIAMHNWDAGWATYSYGKPRQPSGPMFVRQPVPPRGSGLVGTVLHALNTGYELVIEAGDPSLADVTARVLRSLAALGYTREDARVRSAMAFLAYHRYEGNGVWWGRWGVNYIAATSYVLTGLRAVGESPEAPYLREAVRWLLAHQNDDGGWGETVDSYRDPARAGRGPSSSTVTAYAVWALAAVGERSRAVDRGVAYLLAHQGADGLWRDEVCQGVLIPNWGYYANTLFATCFALEALGAYRARMPG